uniref:fructose-bisphosphatase n=1 Tax=Strigamia maritima TaxID=126957 RepID=T1IX18_STRMM
MHRFVMEEQKKSPHATGEFTQLITSILTCVKAVAECVATAGIYRITENKPNYDYLDQVANKLFVNMIRTSFTTCLMVSSESQNLIEVALKDQGKYVVCFDPICGTPNVDCSAPIGSIFSIHKRLPEPQPNSCVVGQPSPKLWPTIEDALQPGREIVAAGYVLYGSATVIMLSTGHGVNGFMLDYSIGEFVLSFSNVRIKPRGECYSINEGHASIWEKAVTQYIHEKKFPKSGKPYRARYSGSMVSDVHRILIEGGIFLYPKTPEKIKLLCECSPMAFIIEQAGGKATNGEMDILDIKPEALHQTTPCYMGSPSDPLFVFIH